jgi:carbonic anhydrase/acetyltransferase-like protein (isoleucine patch superfamily)
MRAYIVSSRKTIEPFGDNPRDCLIANETLKASQESVLRGLNIDFVIVEEAQIHDPEEHLILTESLYFNRELLVEFISRSREMRRNTVCALMPGISTIRTIVATQDVKIYDDRVEYNLRYIPSLRQRGETVPVVIDTGKYREILRMPEHLTNTSGYEIPLPDKFVIQIDFWTNLWAANMVSLLAPVAKLMQTPKWKLLGAAFRAGSLNQWKVASKLNQIGSNCDIHPSAYVEGSIVGNNVTIGAGSVVIECNIADNVSIENNITLNFAVIGAGSYLADGCIIRYSVINPNTFFGFSTLSCQTLGRNCFIGDGVTLTDFRLDRKNVTVLKNGTVIDTDNRILGSCIGHDSYLAAGTIVAPGRAIPSGMRITPEDSHIVQKIPAHGTMPGYRLVNKVDGV